MCCLCFNLLSQLSVFLLYLLIPSRCLCRLLQLIRNRFVTGMKRLVTDELWHVTCVTVCSVLSVCVTDCVKRLVGVLSVCVMACGTVCIGFGHEIVWVLSGDNMGFLYICCIAQNLYSQSHILSLPTQDSTNNRIFSHYPLLSSHL